MKNLKFSSKITRLTTSPFDRHPETTLKTIIQKWVDACINSTVSGNIMLVYNNIYHGISPRWEQDLATELKLKHDMIKGQRFYMDREIMNQICRELYTWAQEFSAEAIECHLTASDIGLCVVCPGEFQC